MRWLWRSLLAVLTLAVIWFGLSWWFLNATPGQYRRLFNVIYRYPMGVFARAPNRLLMKTVANMQAGLALDVAMGEGRNAVFLATKGWDVTGFDVSDEALKQAAQRAADVGVTLHLVREGSETFDYGSQQWNLIVLSYAFAPIQDRNYIERLRTSLKPGGTIVFEHYVQTPGVRPIPGSPVRGQLRDLFRDFTIQFYEEKIAPGDWQFGRTAPLVRMVAVRAH